MLSSGQAHPRQNGLLVSHSRLGEEISRFEVALTSVLDRKLSPGSRIMSGTHRKGFTWKEVAEVLRITRTVTRVSFWSEIRRSRSKKEKAQPSAMAIQEERGPDIQKVGKPGESRF